MSFSSTVNRKGRARKGFPNCGFHGAQFFHCPGGCLEKPDRRVYCLDGDGAFIMHMGAVSNIGDLSPKNYRHVLFNNGAHESVGGQPTLGFRLDIAR